MGNHYRYLDPDKGVWSGIETREEVRLIRVADGKVVGRYTGHMGGIGCLSFSPDGRRLASGGQDTTVLLWEVPER
jgi:WD40 repeat protein